MGRQHETLPAANGVDNPLKLRRLRGRHPWRPSHVRRLRLARGVCAMDLVEQLLDPILSGHGIVVDEA